MLQEGAPRLILASASAGRAALLHAAGLSFEAIPAAIDEAEIKRSAAAEGLPVGDLALLLAELKAVRISRRHPAALVIGADQILVCNGRNYDKPADLEEARTHLQSLRGQTHQLVTAVTVLRAGMPIWRDLATPSLTMRNISDAWITAYLAQQGPAILASVGAYQIEGPGLQCFTAINGAQSAIIGLPMLPLLELLRQHGVLLS